MAEDRRPVSRLDITGPAHIVAERWRKWRRSLEFYLAGQDIDNPARKRSLLLHYAGTAVQDIYNPGQKKRPLRLCIKSEHCKSSLIARRCAAMREVAASCATVPIS